jgi:ABC-type spermidine/putrescine transport system permease subunit I
MTKFDPDLLYAARSMGASAVQAFWLVFFPCTRVGLMAGLLLVFLLSLGYYITPVLLGGPGDQPVAVLINSQVVNQLNWGLAGSMSAIVIAAVLLLLAAGWRLVERVFLADR